jgi:hypothetical protein
MMNTIVHSFFDTTFAGGSVSCEPRSELSAPTRKKQPLVALLLSTIGALLLSGCAGGITGIALDSNAHTVCDSTGTVCGVSDLDSNYFVVPGHGKCDRIGVNFGDGTTDTAPGNFYLLNSAPIPFRHEYTAQFPQGSPRAWPGPRTVHAYSISNCVGEAKMQVNVLFQRTNAAGQVTFLPAFRVGIGAAPTAIACNVPDISMKPIRMGSTVSITERTGGPTMSFGCAGDPICQNNNTAGNSGATHPGFPFPDMGRHSLVLRIVDANGGAKAWQGGPITRFVADRTGPLEFCVNDTVMSDNSGAWSVDVLVDETAVP